MVERAGAGSLLLKLWCWNNILCWPAIPQPQEETEAALAKIKEWQGKIVDAKGTDRTALLQDMISEFSVIYITDGDPLFDPKHQMSVQPTETLKLHGLARGVTGYMMVDLQGDEELEDTLIRISGCTWMPQMWAGGKFVGGWRDIVNKHNSGVLVDILGSVGIKSKLKGTYYEGKSPLVLH